MKNRLDYQIQTTPLLITIERWLKVYCNDVRIIDNEILFSFNNIGMRLSADNFTKTAYIIAEVFNAENHEDNEHKGHYTGYDFLNLLNLNMYPYSFSWKESVGTIEARKTFGIHLTRGLEFLLKVEIYRISYLCQQVEKAYLIGNFSDFPDDENWMQFLLLEVDKWVAADLLDINILYLHGFRSSGNSGTATEIQECLPNAKVVSPDLPINPAEALSVIHNCVSHNRIDIVIGTSMGGLLTLFSRVRNRILVNPSFHVSKMMKRKLDGAETVTLPYYKMRKNGDVDFLLTQNIANSYANLELNVFRQSQLDPERILGIFGIDDDVVNCKDECLAHTYNIRYFKGGHRLNKDAVQKVIIPAILQMIINEKQS